LLVKENLERIVKNRYPKAGNYREFLEWNKTSVYTWFWGRTVDRTWQSCGNECFCVLFDKGVPVSDIFKSEILVYFTRESLLFPALCLSLEGGRGITDIAHCCFGYPGAEDASSFLTPAPTSQSAPRSGIAVL